MFRLRKLIIEISLCFSQSMTVPVLFHRLVDTSYCDQRPRLGWLKPVAWRDEPSQRV